jgi:hypothetical protein
MNSDIERTGAEMRTCLGELVNYAQEVKEVPEAIFAKADHVSRELARLLKGHEMLPQKFLQNLHMTAGILENEAPYCKNQQKVKEMAMQLQDTLGLILWGECHDDYKPGIPRIR